MVSARETHLCQIESKLVRIYALHEFHTNVLMHVQGYFRNQLTLRQRQELTSAIDSYRREVQPLLAPLMLLKHYMAEHPNTWLSGQHYFELWPAILRLRCEN